MGFDSKAVLDANGEEIEFCRMVYDTKNSVKKSLRTGRSEASRAAKTKYDNNVTLTGELDNIARGVTPIQEDSGGISAHDAIFLTQKAYWNVAIFRQTIDTQTEFCNSGLRFFGTNKTAVRFFENWDKRICGWDFRNQFFREFFRSGNIFTYRFDGPITYSEFRKVTRASKEEAAEYTKVTKEIPLRYILLNPGDMRVVGASSFIDAEYSKLLTQYEVDRLKKPSTPQEKEFVNSLDEKAQKAIQSGNRPTITLNAERLSAVFAGKQDYEALAIPMYLPVLQSIDLKLELQKAEKVIARTVDYAVLLITAGRESKNGEDNSKINSQIIQGITELFSNESVGRVLVSDYSTKGEFLIPDLSKIFGEAKYKVVNDDISSGLMNLFYADEAKFANSTVKMQIFMERLNQARETYLNKFLRPEMQRIGEILGFKDVPEVKFDEVYLNDNIEMKKLYVRLGELGLLTADEVVKALSENLLPTPEDSVTSQEKYKTMRKGKLYQPLVGGPKEQEGKKKGSKVTKKKAKPIGGSFSLSEIQENVQLINNLSILTESYYKEKHDIKRLSKAHKQQCWAVTEMLIANEKKENWESKLVEYLVSPPPVGENTEEIETLAAEHGVSTLVAALLFNSQKE